MAGTHWCDCCLSAVEWVGVLQDLDGSFGAFCPECFDLILQVRDGLTEDAFILEVEKLMRERNRPLAELCG